MKKLTKSELVKIFTKVPNEFIDDFYRILQNATTSNNEEFPIDLDLICKWLNSPKDAIKKTLNKSYIKGADYIIKVLGQDEKPKGRGGLNRIIVKMTIDCFKRLCMRSRTARAELVRTYFIELDDFISHYADQISDGIMNDIKNVANKMNKNSTKDGPGYIYVLRVAKELVKLGYATDLMKRLAVYNTGRVEDVEVLYAFRTESRKRVEGCIKGLLEAKRYKKRREIYEADLDIVKKLINGCNKMSLEIIGKKEKSTQDGKYYLMFMKQDGGVRFDSV